jgi:hypothetical protein
MLFYIFKVLLFIHKSINLLLLYFFSFVNFYHFLTLHFEKLTVSEQPINVIALQLITVGWTEYIVY